MSDGKIVVKNRFYKGKKKAGIKLSKHLKYLEHRPRNEEQRAEDRHFFDAEHDHVPRKEVQDDLMQHQAKAVNYHHLVLSPDPQEPVSDLREWTRAIMDDLAETKGLQLHWYAMEHYNTIEHPHSHVVLAGAGETHDGTIQTVRIDRDDLDFLRQSGLEHSDHDLFQMMDQLHEQNQEYSKDAVPLDIPPLDLLQNFNDLLER